MISRHRQPLLYRKRHSENLRTDVAAPRIPLAGPAEERRKLATETRYEPADADRPDVQPVKKTWSQPESSHVTFRTNASTIRTGELSSMALSDLFVPSVADSDSRTTLAASEATRDIRVEIPPWPSNKEGLGMTRFKFKYCFLTPYIRSDHAWK